MPDCAEFLFVLKTRLGAQSLFMDEPGQEISPFFKGGRGGITQFNSSTADVEQTMWQRHRRIVGRTGGYSAACHRPSLPQPHDKPAPRDCRVKITGTVSF